MLARFPSQALIRRELLTSLRRGRSFALVALLAAICIFAVLVQWPSPDQIRNQAARISYDLVNTLGWTLMIGCVLLVPGMAASAIVSEKDRDTFDLLHVTLIPPRGIVFGKLVNVLGLYALLMTAILPIVGVVFFLVGVGWGELIVRVVAICLASLSLGAVGVLCSAWFRRGIVALLVSYVGMLIVISGPTIVVILPLIVADALNTGLERDINSWLDSAGIMLVSLFPSLPSKYQEGSMWVISLAQMTSPLGPLLDGGPMLPFTAVKVVVSIFYQFAFAGMCLWLATRALRRPPKPARVDQRKPIDDAALLEARRKRFPFYLVDPLRRKESIEDGRNPMYVKEIRWGVLGRMTTLIRVFYIALAANMIGASMCIVSWMESSRNAPAIASSMIALTIVTCLFAPALLANTFTKEREYGNLDTLRMTLLTPGEIVFGKFAGGVAMLSPLVGAAAIVSLLIAFVPAIFAGDPDLFAIAFQGFVTLLVCAGVTLSVSLFASLHAKQAKTAIVSSYGLSLMFFVGLSIGAYFACAYALDAGWVRVPPSGGYYGAFLREESYCLLRAGWFSPLGGFWAAYFAGTRRPDAMTWLISTVGYSLLSFGLLAHCRHVFNSERMRD